MRCTALKVHVQSSTLFFYCGTTSLLRFLVHTHPVGLLWMSDQPVAEAATYTTHNKHKIWTSIPSAGFKPTLPPTELPYTARPPESAQHTEYWIFKRRLNNCSHDCIPYCENFLLLILKFNSPICMSYNNTFAMLSHESIEYINRILQKAVKCVCRCFIRGSTVTMTQHVWCQYFISSRCKVLK